MADAANPEIITLEDDDDDIEVIFDFNDAAGIQNDVSSAMTSANVDATEHLGDLGVHPGCRKCLEIN